MRNFKSALALLAFAPAAGAVDHLFPTDVLGAGETDFAVGVGYNQFTVDSGGFEVESTYTTATAQFRAGIADRLHFGVRVPYLAGGETCVSFGGTESCGDLESEFGDVSVLTAFQLSGNERAPFASTFTLRYDTNSSGDDFDGLVAELTGGWATGSGGRFHAGVARSFYNNDLIDDYTALTLGVFPASDDGFRIVPEAYYQRFDAGQGYDAYSAFGGQLAAHCPVGRDVFLIPSLSYSHVEFPEGGSETSDGAFVGGMVTLYAGFGGEPAPRATRRSAAARPAPVAAMPAAAPAPKPAPVVLAVGEMTLSKPAGLYPGPRADAQPLATLDAGATVTLKTRMVNAAGVWWYASAGDRPGWVREGDLR
jgi:hypothetical protein